ncbi:unnamed protein product [Ambrosiozyma monospora]|uniref:Unnamed protein product n=1 Tax=Ambrosiozyma monospora TaxID=43982 RepID=A0ACB5SYW8_AMBMO|nr:unnamed protein product [Ambrosiozyma monospora]
MQPTKRPDSYVSTTDDSSIQPSIRNNTKSVSTSDSATTPKDAKIPITSQSAPVEPAAVPEPSIKSPTSTTSNAPPPPPSARKHTSTDAPTSNSRSSRGAAPAPPQQRRSVLVEQSSAPVIPEQGSVPVQTSSSVSAAPVGVGAAALGAAGVAAAATSAGTSASSPAVETIHVTSSAPSTPKIMSPTSSSTPASPSGASNLQAQGTGVSTMSRNVTGGTGGLVSGQIAHPSLTTPGLNASIVELFNASFKDGQLVRSNAIGEVAFSYIMDEAGKKFPSKIDLNVVSKSGQPLPNFMANPLFLEQSTENPALFAISDPSQIHLRTVGGLKYMLNGPTPPVVVQPIWKHEERQSTVIISIKPSEQLNSFLQNGNALTLSNFVVSVSTAGAQATSAATKPSGSFNREKNRVTWNLSGSPVKFTAQHNEERLIARFMTSGLSRESDAGVQLRFTINSEDGAFGVTALNSDLEISSKSDAIEDPFSSTPEVDESLKQDWTVVPTMKTVVAGGYSGHS